MSKSTMNGRLYGWLVKIDRVDEIKPTETTLLQNTLGGKENIINVKNVNNGTEEIPPRRSSRFLKKKSQESKDEQPVAKEPDIKTLPAIVFHGKIKYVNSFEGCAQVCHNILTDIEKSEESLVPIGFDLEWPFSFQTGSGKTALVQICMSLDVCYLLHVYELSKLPAGLIVILQHPKVKLVGVNIKNDVWKLSRDFQEFQGQKSVDNNCLDCGPYCNKVFGRSGRWSLQNLTAFLLQKQISKDRSVRNSKWHIQPLSDAQKLYAATDAYVSLLLYLKIRDKEVALITEEKLGEV